MVDGWIVNFFPYDKYGKRNNLDSISMRDVLPNEIVKVDLKYESGDGQGNFVTTPLELWAGFVGLRQNDKTFELKPEIGWMIRKKGVVNDEKIITQLKAENSTANSPVGFRPEGIRISVKTVPKELFEIGPIHSLVIFFVDGIQIPDEMGKIKIERLELYGKVDDAGIDRICKLFPNITIRINDKQYKDGKSYDAL